MFKREVQLDFSVIIYPAVATDVLEALDQCAANAVDQLALDAFSFEAVFRQHHQRVVDFGGELAGKTEEDTAFTTVRALMQGRLQIGEQVLWSRSVHDSSAKLAKRPTNQSVLSIKMPI